jgi:rRNA maturation endonuclease Nob1
MAIGSKCVHIRGKHVVPGWGCHVCKVYNGYQHQVCKNCGHSPCFSTRGKEGREARELQPIGSNPALVLEWLDRNKR